MPKGKSRHLTIQDRIEIQKGIEGRDSFASIARAVDLSTSTISREVHQNREIYIPKSRTWQSTPLVEKILKQNPYSTFSENNARMNAIGKPKS